MCSLKHAPQRNNGIKSFASLLLWLGVAIGSAQAEVAFNAGVRTGYDSNVNGVARDAEEESDQFVSAAASVLYYTALDAAKTTYFVGQLGAISNRYDRYDVLDNSALILSGGLYRQLNADWSAQISVRNGLRQADQSARDTDSLGSTVEIKNQLTPQLWIKLVGDIEDADADLDYFSYTGSSVGVLLGYQVRANTFINGGYTYTQRDFATAADFETKTDTYFVEATQRLSSQWYLSGSYALKDNRSNIDATDYENHVVAVGINFHY